MEGRNGTRDSNKVRGKRHAERNARTRELEKIDPEKALTASDAYVRRKGVARLLAQVVGACAVLAITTGVLYWPSDSTLPY